MVGSEKAPNITDKFMKVISEAWIKNIFRIYGNICEMLNIFKSNYKRTLQEFASTWQSKSFCVLQWQISPAIETLFENVYAYK